jgi:hypothetical protein
LSYERNSVSVSVNGELQWEKHFQCVSTSVPYIHCDNESLWFAVKMRAYEWKSRNQDRSLILERLQYPTPKDFRRIGPHPVPRMGITFTSKEGDQEKFEEIYDLIYGQKNSNIWNDFSLAFSLDTDIEVIKLRAHQALSRVIQRINTGEDLKIESDFSTDHVYELLRERLKQSTQIELSKFAFSCVCSDVFDAIRAQTPLTFLERYISALRMNVMDRESKRVRDKALLSIFKEFITIGRESVRTIIDELHLPVDRKTIKPLGLGGVAGGEKFQHNG